MPKLSSVTAKGLKIWNVGRRMMDERVGDEWNKDDLHCEGGFNRSAASLFRTGGLHLGRSNCLWILFEPLSVTHILQIVLL